MSKITLRNYAASIHRWVDSFDSKLWIRTTVSSRFVVVTAMMISNLLVVDHFPGDDVPSYNFGNMCQSSNTPLVIIQNLLSSFTKWDSSHYLTIATDGKFKQDKHLAFYPLYPSLIRQTARALWLFSLFASWIFALLLKLVSASPLQFFSQGNITEVITGFTVESDVFSPETPTNQTYCYVVVASILVSNVSFIMSVWVLRQILLIIIRESTFLTGAESIDHDDLSMKGDIGFINQQNQKSSVKSNKLCSSDSKLVDYALLSYICNPANVFFSSAYTESFYSLLTFTAVWLIELSCRESSDDNLRHRHVEALSDAKQIMRKDSAMIPKVSKTVPKSHRKKEVKQLPYLNILPYETASNYSALVLHPSGDEKPGPLIPENVKKSMYTVIAGVFFFLSASTRSNGLLNSVFTFLVVIKRVTGPLKECVRNSSADVTFSNVNVPKSSSVPKSPTEHSHVRRSDGTKTKGGIGDIQRVLSSILYRCVSTMALLCVLLSTVTPYYMANEHIRDLLCDKSISIIWGHQHAISNTTQSAHESDIFKHVWNLKSTIYHAIKRAAPAAEYYQKSIGTISGSGLGVGSNQGVGTGIGIGDGEGSDLEGKNFIEKCCVSDLLYLSRKYDIGEYNSTTLSPSLFPTPSRSSSPSPLPPPSPFLYPYFTFLHYSDYYSAVQRTYWNVGFLRYYKVKQIPNFLLACPIISVSIFTLVTLSRKLHSLYDDSTQKGNNKMFNPLLSSCYRRSYRAVRVCFLCATSCVGRHLIHLLLVTLVGVLVAHVQIITRLICSSCPIIYIGLATLFSPSDIGRHGYDQEMRVEENVKRKKKRKQKKERGVECCASSVKRGAVEGKSDAMHSDHLSLRRRKSKTETITGSVRTRTMKTLTGMSEDCGCSEEEEVFLRNSNLSCVSYIEIRLRRVTENAPHFVMAYLLLFNLLGVLLHPNFYPWT